ncbi:copper amine oxidase N-terminal domain-containing protein [Paenibacillus nanensis]|nr:copper amine oxidase N-terminal domain-containing protein [Paenibacillus nanensis]
MRKSRIVWIGLLLIAMLVTAPLNAFAADKPNSTVVNIKTQNVKLNFDGQELKLPEGQYAFIYQGRTYVPIRYISYALLKQVGWDAAENKVTVSEPTEEELAELKKQLQLVVSGNTKPKDPATIPFKPKAAKLVFDGKEKKLPAGQSLYIYKGSIYVPVRFLSESVGTEINWDPETRTVKGESAAYREEQGGDSKTPDGEAENGKPGAGGGGAPAAKPTYEEITASAEAAMTSLKASCQATLMSLALSYSGADDAGKATIKAQAIQEIDRCTASFNGILADTSAKLTANDYSTAIIEEYRAAFQAELDAGRQLAENL